MSDHFCNGGLGKIRTRHNANGERLFCAWENEMKREEMMIGRVKENLSMFVRIDTRDVDGLCH